MLVTGRLYNELSCQDYHKPMGIQGGLRRSCGSSTAAAQILKPRVPQTWEGSGLGSPEWDGKGGLRHWMSEKGRERAPEVSRLFSVEFMTGECFSYAGWHGTLSGTAASRNSEDRSSCIKHYLSCRFFLHVNAGKP